MIGVARSGIPVGISEDKDYRPSNEHLRCELRNLPTLNSLMGNCVVESKNSVDFERFIQGFDFMVMIYVENSELWIQDC